MRRNAIATITLLALLALASPLYPQVAITGLPELAETPAADDVVPIVDTSESTTKKVTVANLMGGAGGGGECAIDMPMHADNEPPGGSRSSTTITFTGSGEHSFARFDALNERITLTRRMPSCYTGQAMDLVIYGSRLNSSDDVTLTFQTACFSHDGGSMAAPTWNTHGTTLNILGTNVSANADLNLYTVTGLTLTGCAAQELLMIGLEATAYTSATGIVHMTLVEQ